MTANMRKKGSEIMYAVIDCYEGEAEIVGRAETVEQAKQIERQWAIDTDYECWTEIVHYEEKPLSGGNR